MSENELKFKSLKSETDRFIEIIHGLYGFYIDSAEGFKLYNQHMIVQDSRGVPGIIWANGSPDNPDAIILNDSSPKEIILRTAIEGPNVNRLRGFMVIMIAEHWNCDIRQKLETILNLNKNDLKSDIMGDVTKIRNDLLHSRGKAKESTRNKIIKFQQDELIAFSNIDFDNLFKEIFYGMNQIFLNHTGTVAYKDHSLNLRSKEIHRSMKHTVMKN